MGSGCGDTDRTGLAARSPSRRRCQCGGCEGLELRREFGDKLPPLDIAFQVRLCKVPEAGPSSQSRTGTDPAPLNWDPLLPKHPLLGAKACISLSEL